MSLRRATSLVLTLLVLAAPAAAWADGGAGDNQYQDPLAAPAAPKKKPAAPVASAPASSAAPAASSAPAPSTPSATTAPAASSRQLPRTGTPAGLIGLSGATLILAGVALRRRTAPR